MISFDQQVHKNIIWIQTAFLGDLVLTTAAINALRQRYPDIKQHIITTPIGSHVFRACKAVDNIIPFDKANGRTLATFSRIKQQLKNFGCGRNNTLILKPHLSHRSSLLAKFIRFQTVTFRQSQLSFLADHRVERVSVFHETQRVAMLLTALGFSREDITKLRPSLEGLPIDENVSWQRALKSFKGQVIAIAPGSVWGTKRWPLSYFMNLTKKLSQRPDTLILLLGSKNEKTFTDQIKSHVRTNDQVVNLAGETNLDDLCRIYPFLSLLISNDSSPIHYASAFNIPTLAFFGATLPAMGFSPLADGSLVLEKRGLSCRPCSDHGPQTCPKIHFRCMKLISADEAYQKSITILDSQMRS